MAVRAGRADRVVAATLLVVALTACGAVAAPSAPSAQTPVPTTDDPSLLTVDPPQVATIDMGTLTASGGPSTVLGVDGLQLDVVSAACGIPGVRSDGYSVRPTGQACLVQVQVVDRADAAVSFDPSRTALVDAEGRTSPPWREALALPALAAMTAQVPPMTTLTGVLVYDVPTGAPPVALVLDGTARAQLP